VNLYGNDLHAVVQHSASALPAIRSRLQAAGVALHQAEVIPASIEDVFVRLTRKL